MAYTGKNFEWEKIYGFTKKFCQENWKVKGFLGYSHGL